MTLWFYCKWGILFSYIGDFIIGFNTIKRLESEKAQKMRAEKEKYLIIIQSIDQAMEIMDESEKEFIKYRYFQKYSIRKIANLMHYTEKHIFSIRKKALEKLKISLSGILYIT